MAGEETQQTAEERIAALEVALADSQTTLAESQASLAESRELILVLHKQVAELTEQLRRNSKNSHLLSMPTAKRGKLRASRRSGVSSRTADGSQPEVTQRRELGARPAQPVAE